MGIFSFVRIIIKNMLILLITLLVILLGVFVIPLLIPLFIWRFVLKFAAKFRRPDLQKLLTCVSSTFAVDEMYSRPKCALISCGTLDGDLDLAKTRKFIVELIKVRDAQGNLIRPEAQQYVVQWMGYYFWKQDEDFRIENHVTEYSGPLKSDAYDADSMTEISRELIAKPFEKALSPWHFYVFRNCKKNLSDTSEKPTIYFIIHSHHCFADGFSLLHAFTEGLSSEGSLTPMKVNAPQMALWKKVSFALTLPILAPFKLVQGAVEAYDSNDLHIPEKKLSGYIQTARLEKIPVDYIKEIKNGYGVSFTSVLLAAFAGGLRNFMLENQIKVPRNIHGAIPLPMPNHSEKLRNHMTGCFVTLPVGISESRKRLLAIDKNLSELSRSSLPHILFFVYHALGALPSFLIRQLGKQTLVSAIVTVFPGPPQQVQFQGIPISDIIVGGGMLPGNIGIGYSSLSYEGFVCTGVGIDRSLLPKNASAKDLARMIAEEFDILWKEASV